MIALLLATAALLSAPAAGQDNSARAATIEALQQAGQNLGTMAICHLAGYEIDDARASVYANAAVEQAKASGMFEQMARNYFQMGMKGRNTALMTQLTELRHMAELRDSAQATTARALADEVVASCDALSTQDDTRALFAYRPANATVAKSNMLRALGESPAAGKRRP